MHSYYYCYIDITVKPSEATKNAKFLEKVSKKAQHVCKKTFELSRFGSEKSDLLNFNESKINQLQIFQMFT